MAFILGQPRYAKVPWGDLEQGDLREQGKPEWLRDSRHERHLGLLVRGQYVGTLGMLMIRCERHQDWLLPVGMSIANGSPVLKAEAEDMLMRVQSNPRRERI